MRSFPAASIAVRPALAVGLLWLSMAAPAAPMPVQVPTDGVQAADTAAACITGDIEHRVAKMQPLIERYGYAGVAGAVSVEGFGLPAPGQTLLMAAAFEAARGHLQIAPLFALAVAAAVIGNSLGYLLGSVGGPPLLRKLRVDEVREQKIAAQFERYGGGIILLARFFDGPRQLNGIVAGTLGMHWRVFTLFNALGALLWVAVWGLGTYFVSEHLQSVEAFIRRWNPWMVGIALVAILALVVYLVGGQRKDTPSNRPS